MTNHHDTTPRSGAQDGPAQPAGPFSATAGVDPTFALVIDIIAVLLFTLIGRLSHDEGFSVGGWLMTSWPFLLGVAVAWGLILSRTLRPAPGTGVGVLLVTWFVGIVVRSLVNMSVVWGFVITSLIFLGILMIGWRVVASLVTRRR